MPKYPKLQNGDKKAWFLVDNQLNFKTDTDLKLISRDVFRGTVKQSRWNFFQKQFTVFGVIIMFMNKIIRHTPYIAFNKVISGY